MNDVDELKQFAVVHARAQNIKGLDALLDHITTDDAPQPGSWVSEWTRAGEALEERGDLLAACRHYGMARFPFVDGAPRQDALDRCVAVFDRWRQKNSRIERLEIEHAGRRFPCWASGLSADKPRPLLLIMGGIVTLKEQWAPVLARARQLGMAGVVAEMPGVGENTVPYDAKSWQLISTVLDQVAGRADVARTYAIALSFSGTLVLRCAVDDHRIRGIVTAGAPIARFFTDETWQRSLPRVTVDTLGHLLGQPGARAMELLREHRLSTEHLAALDIPVCSIVSKQDEIIPYDDARALRDNVRSWSAIEIDDVHGSPDHVGQTRLWTVLSVLRMRGDRPVQRAAVAGMLRMLSARSRLTGRPA